jgi:hypothetical protein
MKPNQTLGFHEVNRFLDGLFDGDLHAKRVLSLANATLGVIRTASLAVNTIGQGLALARGLVTKHAIKQVDRLLSNEGIDIDAALRHWVPYVVGPRPSIKVAMDWTAFRQRELFGVSAPLARANETPDVRRFGAFGSRQRNA